MSVAGIETPNPTELLRETNHRIANHLSLLVGIIPRPVRSDGVPNSFRAIRPAPSSRKPPARW